jgi:capsular exopolysaccharide synthesis family protein
MARALSMAQAGVGELPVREVHLREYWKVVWQGRWTAAAVFLLVVGVTIAWTFLQTPIYRATAVVEIQPQARRLAPGQDVSGLGAAGYGWFAEEKYQNTQIEIVKSRAVAERAFKVLGLANDPRFRSLPDPVGAFAGLIKVEPRRETGLIEISIEGPDRNEAARWANAVADCYVERNLEKARENARSAVSQIEKELQRLRTGVEQAETKRYELLEETELYSPENQQQIIKEKLQKLNAELTETTTRRAKLGSVLAAIRDLENRGGDPMTIPELAQDEVLQKLNDDKIRVELELEKARVSLRKGNPAYQALESQLNTVLSRIRDRIANKKAQLQSEYELAQSSERKLEAEIRQAEQTAYQLGLATSKFSLVNTDAQTKKEIFDVINKTMQQVALGAELLANNVTLLDHAIPPLQPVKPKKKMNLFLGSLLGLFLGLGTVFFLDYLDNTFRSPEEIESALGLSTLAVVPRRTEEEADSHAVREAFQSLRTSLIFSSKNRERKVVLVTSSAPKEGKSNTVALLARTLAGAGDRVLVLDADLRRPTLHLHFQVGRDRGLTDYLAAPKGVEEWAPFVRATSVPRLDLITSGPIPPNPPELLGGERFARLLARAREQYDWVLVDSPPAISLADAVLLASQADMVVLVVRHAHTDRDAIARSLQQFRSVQANVVGVVLNNVDMRRAGQREYYYAGYYYYTSEEGGGRERRKRPAREKEPTGVGT